MSPSQIAILRWVRKLPKVIRQMRTGLNSITSAPASRSGAQNRSFTLGEPIPS